MDIPVPERTESSAGEKVAVTVAPSAKTVAKEAPATIIQPKPADALSNVDEKNKRIVELVTSKKYVFAIKEKRSSPLITLGFGKTRGQKGPKKHSKSHQNHY